MKKFQKLEFQNAFDDAIKSISKKTTTDKYKDTVTSAVQNDSLVFDTNIKAEIINNDNLDIQTARTHLAECVLKGRLSADVLLGLQTISGFLPVEGSLLDYKRDIPNTNYEYAKLIKHICAFHNVYGGYLIIGVEELEKDKILIPIYKEAQKFIDSKKLRDLCREYTGTSIEIQTAEFQISFKKTDWYLQLIHIPTRTAPMPVAFRKKSPANEKGSIIFDRDEVVLRDGDNSIKAIKTEHWRLLISHRIMPFSRTGDLIVLESPIWNNLPDRHLIFSTFIGRDSYILKLYKWFSDDFSCVRVLAGAGGLGKTSIAYQFASEICTNKIVEFNSVLWITAKLKQFRPLIDKYEDIAVTHFSTARELFSELAKNLAATDDEVDAISDAQFPRFLRDLLQQHRIFIICDDLDSLEIEDQKRVVEVFQQLGGLGSRFLLTTRKNTTASAETAIELKGLTIEEYPKLIAYWSEQLLLPNISSKEMNRLYEASLGSPLYTESIFRLVKSGYTLSDSITKWKGVLGEEVRNAALQREVEQLGNEAKKVLVTVAILDTCSLAELKVKTGFSDLTLIDATNELQTLFLITAPSIANEPRFSISSTTRILVNSHGPALIPSFVSYRDQLLSQKFKPKGTTNLLKDVGAAIDQANALLSAHRPEEALKTVEEINKQFGGNNSDLIFMAARSLTYHRPPKLIEASKQFNKAFNLGQRKFLFFSLWFETEIQINRFESAVEVAGRALDASAGENDFWLRRRANAHLRVAAIHNKSGDFSSAITQLQQAADDLASCPDKKGELILRQEWESQLFSTHDALILIHSRGGQDVPEVLLQLDDIVEFPKRGDRRIEIYLKAEELFSKLRLLTSWAKSGYSNQQFNLIATQARRCNNMFRDAPANLNNFSLFRIAKERLLKFSLS